MPDTVPGKAYQAKRARGVSTNCASFHHGVCGEPETCTCSCHGRVEATAHELAGRKAAETRRARAAQDGDSSTRSATPTRETAPKRPDLKTGHKSPIPAAAAKQLKSEFALLVWGADGIVAGARPDLWKTPDDRLTEGEISALTGAVYGELEARAPGLLKILAKAQESAPEAALVYTVAMIAIPRLARREATVLGVKITPEFARAVVLAPLVFAQQAATQQSTAGVESVAAPISDRPNGNGQIDPRGAPFEGSPVQVGAPVEAGQRDVRHGPDYQNGAWNAGHAP